jgi:DNA polymerase elongation subunit (family B)
MTYTPRKLPRLFFDLETAANPEALTLAPEPIIEAPANYKDPEKIAAYVAEKTAAAKAELVERAALDPDYGKILSIGYSFGPELPVQVIAAGDPVCVDWDTEGNETVFRELTESDLINDFWKAFASCDGRCVGFNILSFDLPYLLARSMYLGIKVPMLPMLAKFRSDPVTDLYAIRYNWGPGKGLKQVCKLLSIPNNCPDVDGSKVKDLDREKLKAYQASDVQLTQALFTRMNGVYFNL